MKVVVGLGNPGAEYENTRHNIGFMIVDALADTLNADNFRSSKFKALTSSALVREEKVILVKPMTFMNLSGDAVGPLLNFYKVTKSDLIVVYDELDLELGRLKFVASGGTGGHNGMKSIVKHVGGQDFNRLRVGIGRPLRKEMVSDYVLSKFKKSETKDLDDLIERACSGLITYLEDGLVRAMNEYN